MGHTRKIAMAHYLTVTEAAFEKVLGKAPQNAQHDTPEPKRIWTHRDRRNEKKPGNSGVSNHQLAEAGLEPPQDPTLENAGQPNRAAKCAVNSDDSDPERRLLAVLGMSNPQSGTASTAELLAIFAGLSEADQQQLISLAQRWRDHGRKPVILPEDGELRRLIDSKRS